MDSLDKIKKIVITINKKFGNNNIHQIMTRFTEELGELAQQVNHFEGAGIKKEKHGTPDRKKFAKELQDCLRCVVQVSHYYQLEKELQDSIEEYYQKTQQQ